MRLVFLIVLLFLITVSVYADNEPKGFWRVIDGRINHCLVEKTKTLCSEFPKEAFSNQVIIIKVKSGRNG